MMQALILVDIQNDFLPGGALAVSRGDEVVEVANRLIPLFPLVVATQDWHPADHLSFASQHRGTSVGDVIDLQGLKQILWPDHCVAETRGAELPPGLDSNRIHATFHKGTERQIDSYSGFFDNGRFKATGLGDALKKRRVTDVYVMGLATDYCVKSTAIDACDLGFRVHMIENGCRGVGLQPQDVSRAVEEMRSRGVRITVSQAIYHKLSTAAKRS